MSRVATNLNVNTPVDLGAPLQMVYQINDIGLSANIAASSSVASNPISTGGYKFITVGLTSSQDGVLSIQRYVDEGNDVNLPLITQGDPLTQIITADVPVVLNDLSEKPYQSLIITVENKGIAIASLINFILLLQSS